MPYQNSYSYLEMPKSIFGHQQNDEIQKFATSLEKMNSIGAMFKSAKTVEDLNTINRLLTQVMKEVAGQNTSQTVYIPEHKK